MTDTFTLDDAGKPVIETAPEAVEAPAAAPAPEQVPAEQAAPESSPAPATPAAEATPQPAPDEDGELPAGTPEWAVREITKERNRRRQAERERAQLIEQFGARIGQTAGQPATQAPQAPAVPTDPQPKQEDFQDPDAYNQAVFQWAVRQEVNRTLKSEREAEAKAKADEEARTLATTYAEREAQTAAKYPDYAAVTNVPSLPISEQMAALIMRSDVGPEIYYHLGKHPAEAAAIARLTPLLQAKELGKLEARLATPVVPAARPVSSAPAPIRPLAAAANTQPATGPDGLPSMEELERQYRRQAGLAVRQ